MKAATMLLVLSVALLLALGLVMLYSSSMTQVGSRYLMLQAVWSAVGIVAAGFVASLDYRKYKNYSWIFLGIALILLGLVFAPHVGLKVNGARRWIGLGTFRIQPSELAKLALIMVLAAYIDRYSRVMNSFWRGLVLPGVIISVTLGLIFVEPDRGTTILLTVVCTFMLLVGGVRFSFILPPVLLGLVGLVISFIHDPMRLERIYSWLHVEETRLGKGMQAYQAMLALGAGGWTGLGLGNGRQKLGFVPEHHTDFIFSIIGEELGLLATIGVILLFLVVLASGIYIAAKARDTFGTLLASGISFLIGIQVFINIGVVTSSLPNKGIALPFISYGGSNMLMMLVAVGILVSVARQAAAVPASQALPTDAMDDIYVSPIS